MFCEHCNTEFKSVSSLNNHKRNAKYCLKLQNNENNENIENKEEYKCTYCNKAFSEKYLKTHISKCINYFELIIDNLKKEINEKEEEFKKILYEKDNEIIRLKVENSFLQNEHNLFINSYQEDRNHIKELTKKPTTIINNSHNINNMLINPIIENIPKIKEKIEHNLNINHIIEGQKGIANFAVNNILKDDSGNITYICTDPSRGFFKFVNENNAIVKDIHAKQLTRNLCKAGLVNKANDIAIASCTDEEGNIDTEKFALISPKTIEISELENNNCTFKSELTSYTTMKKN